MVDYFKAFSIFLGGMVAILFMAEINKRQRRQSSDEANRCSLTERSLLQEFQEVKGFYGSKIFYVYTHYTNGHGVAYRAAYGLGGVKIVRQSFEAVNVHHSDQGFWIRKKYDANGNALETVDLMPNSIHYVTKKKAEIPRRCYGR